MSKVTLVHGFWDNNGHHTTDLLTPFFKDKQIRCRGIRLWLHGPARSPPVERQAGRRACRAHPRPRQSASATATAARSLQKASFLGAPFSQLVFINPALDADATVGTQVKRIHVWHSPSDLPVRFANLFVRHPWGEMGATGYKGTDPRFINYNKENDFDVSSRSHLDIFFVKEKLDFFGPLIVKAVVENGAA